MSSSLRRPLSADMEIDRALAIIAGQEEILRFGSVSEEDLQAIGKDAVSRIRAMGRCGIVEVNVNGLTIFMESINANTDNMEWVIVGAESGKNARNCELKWIDDIVNVCHSKKIPVFVNNINENGNVTDKFEKVGYRQNFLKKE